jgi:1,2-diacylglycerol 3-beta-galactosyltransferase
MSAFFGGGGIAKASPRWPLGPGPINQHNSKKTKSNQQRILILMSDTGGGHRASAEAIKQGFHDRFGDKYTIEVIDFWTYHTPWPFNQMPKTYSFMVQYSFLWRMAFTSTQPRLVHIPMSTATSAWVGRHISEAYAQYSPDLVISVHPLMQHIPINILRAREKRGLCPKTNFATVVTDLTTCHNTWFHPGADRCYIATAESERQALSLGLRQDQLRLYGLPIRPNFAKKFPSKKSLRRSLGMDADAPAVLLVGGGEGMGPVEKTVDALRENVGSGCQLVVICGRNARLVEVLKRKKYPDGMHVVIKGFVDNMPELMCASDVIVTKAGPGTISEALICGLPMILNAFVPCQEEGNIPYVTENRVGSFEDNPAKVAGLIKEWFGEKRSELAAMAKRARALGRPDALFRIVDDLSTLVAPA